MWSGISNAKELMFHGKGPGEPGDGAEVVVDDKPARRWLGLLELLGETLMPELQRHHGDDKDRDQGIPNSRSARRQESSGKDQPRATAKVAKWVARTYRVPPQKAAKSKKASGTAIAQLRQERPLPWTRSQAVSGGIR